MYETEANGKQESAEQLPAEVLDEFRKLKTMVLSRTVLPWSEHCTECVWPTCYKTCDLYRPREDNGCRRFVDGMVRIDCPEAANRYVLKIRFKQWAKLWTPGNLQLHTLEDADRIERRDFRLGTMLYQLPLPKPMKAAVIAKRYSWKKKGATRRRKGQRHPTSFLIECFNPTEGPVSLSLTIRSSKEGGLIPFQKLLNLEPGFNRIRCSFDEMAALIDFTYPFQVELVPNSFAEELTLFFGLMDFVEEASVAANKKQKIKCVVWDLDHTIWDGVLVEDGAENLVLKPGILNLMETLDQRGILQSVASKNNHDEAMAALSLHELQNLILHPQISWGPKGEAIKTIARRLNIGIESIVFIDDQPFERTEVESSCFGVRTMDALDYLTLIELEECKVPITDESKGRRMLYRVEQERQEVQEGFKDDYKAFLKDCDIRLTVTSLTNENLERVHELAQRTNQMNFSGNRYDRGLLQEILQTAHLDTYVLRCEDRFGSYGIVGFGIVDKREPRLTDLMFSCRIQSKRVEHAFLNAILGYYVSTTGRDFYANYRKTVRNMQSGRVFTDLGMVETDVLDGVAQLVFSRHCQLSDDCIIRVSMPEQLTLRS